MVAAAVAVVVLGGTTLAGFHLPNVRPLDVLGYGWLAAGVVPLLWRNRFPLITFLVSAAMVISYYRSGYPPGPAILSLTIALFTLATLSGPLTAAIAGAAATAVLVGVDFTLYQDFRSMGTAVWVAAVVGVGAAIRARRAQAQEELRRRDEEARLRVARDVHDVVAHSLAMINVQAGVGAHVADRRPEEAKQALLAIKDASRDALTELRSTLDLLRTGEMGNGLARVPDLATGGLRLDVHGDPGTLPPDVDATAFRIVQECVTNAVRHASGATTITVRYTRRDGLLDVVICDDGDSPEGIIEGNGLRGMRERVETVGGTLTIEAGPRFHAELPVTRR